MQMNEKQTLLAGAAALALIVFGALFWIAPVWQFGYAPGCLSAVCVAGTG